VCRPDQTIDRFRAVVLELGERGRLGEADLPAFERFQRHAGLGGGLGGRHGILAHRQLGHPRHGQTCVDHLLDAPRALRVAEVALLVVGDDLVHDAVDRLGGGICCRRGEDVDRNRGQTDFARRDGSTLPVGPPPRRRGGESR
jgi:hypothetical protein